MMGLSINEVVHHDNVVRLVVVRTRCNIACRDPYTGDSGIVKLDPEEGKTSITRGSRDKTAEQQTAVSTEKLEQRACSAVATLRAWTTTVGLIDVSEDRTEAGNYRSRSSV